MSTAIFNSYLILTYGNPDDLKQAFYLMQIPKRKANNANDKNAKTPKYGFGS
jgi:hypothetical protein